MSEATGTAQVGTATIFDMYDALEHQNYRPGQLVVGVLGASDGTWTAVDVAGQPGKVRSEDIVGLSSDGDTRFFIEEVTPEELLLSYHKAARLHLWNWFEEKRGSGAAIDAVVIGETRGEIVLEVHGVKVLMAPRDLDKERPREIDSLKGETIQVRVVKLREKKAQIMVSERALTEGDPVIRKAATLDSLAEGQIVEGEVRRFAGFGAFVDIGGIDGLLHVKDIQWKRVDHPSHVLSIGDVLDLKVLRFDRETEKVALGLKQMRPDPWEDAASRYTEGLAVSGDVVGLTDFGAFIMMEDGIEGLVHVSEMSWTEKVSRPGDVLAKGQAVTAWVVRCEMDRRRLGLTLRDPAENPWRKVADGHPVGSTLSTTVTSVAEFGLFVDLGYGLEGLVHTSDFSWTPISEAPSELYTVGQALDVMVLDVDFERGRANLGIKQLSEDLTVELMNKYSVGQTINATVTSILSYGVFAQIESGLEGLIHISELGREVEDPSDILSAGQDVSVEIIQLDPEDNRVSLRLLSLEASAEADNPKTQPADVPVESEAAPAEADGAAPDSDVVHAASDSEGEAEAASADADEASSDSAREAEAADDEASEAAAEPAIEEIDSSDDAPLESAAPEGETGADQTGDVSDHAENAEAAATPVTDTEEPTDESGSVSAIEDVVAASEDDEASAPTEETPEVSAVKETEDETSEG